MDHGGIRRLRHKPTHVYTFLLIKSMITYSLFMKIVANTHLEMDGASVWHSIEQVVVILKASTIVKHVEEVATILDSVVIVKHMWPTAKD
jgi:hypothetical protein